MTETTEETDTGKAERMLRENWLAGTPPIYSLLNIRDFLVSEYKDGGLTGYQRALLRVVNERLSRYTEEGVRAELHGIQERYRYVITAFLRSMGPAAYDAQCLKRGSMTPYRSGAGDNDTALRMARRNAIREANASAAENGSTAK